MVYDILQDKDYSIFLSQETILSQIDQQQLLICLKERGDNASTAEHAKIYRRIIGKMLYFGHDSAPFLLFFSSAAATKLSKLHTQHLRMLSAKFKRFKS